MFDKKVKDDVERMSANYQRIKLSKVVAYHKIMLMSHRRYEKPSDFFDPPKVDAFNTGTAMRTQYMDVYNYDGTSDQLQARYSAALKMGVPTRTYPRSGVLRKKNVWKFYPKQYMDLEKDQKNVDYDTLMKSTGATTSRDYLKIWNFCPLMIMGDDDSVHEHFQYVVSTHYYFVFKLTGLRSQEHEYLYEASGNIRKWTTGFGGKNMLPGAFYTRQNWQITPEIAGPIPTAKSGSGEYAEVSYDDRLS